MKLKPFYPNGVGHANRADPIENNANLLVTAYNNLMDYLKITGTLNLAIPFCYSPESITEERKNQAKKPADSLTCRKSV